MISKLIETPSEDFLCSRYRLDEVPSTAQLLEQLSLLSDQYPEFRFLITLDQIGQACYTSMHSTLNFDLDETEGYDLSELSEDCFEEGEHKGYLSFEQEFFIRKGNFEKQLPNVSFEDICLKGISYKTDGPNNTPCYKQELSFIIDRESYILKVPVSRAYETMYAFPNGYFSCDLNPFENVYLAKLLEEKYFLELIGIGASYLAFKKTRELGSKEVQKLTELLSKVYQAQSDEEFNKEISTLLSSGNILILKYTE